MTQEIGKDYWNKTGDNNIRMKFIVPVGNKSPKKAKLALKKLMASFKTEIKFDEDIKINGDEGKKENS